MPDLLLVSASKVFAMSMMRATCSCLMWSTRRARPCQVQGFTRGVRLNHTMRLRLANSESSANDLHIVLKEMNSNTFQCQLSLEEKAANSPHIKSLAGSIPGTGFGVVFNRIMVDAIRGASESA